MRDTQMIPPFWDHQTKAIKWALEHPAASMLDMPPGTGKTRVAIEIADSYYPRNTLVVCKKRGLDVWPYMVSEYARWNYTVVAPKGSMAKRVMEYKEAYNRDTGPNIFVVNYDVVWQEPVASTLRSMKWDLLVLDESHVAKKPGGRRTKFLSLLAQSIPKKIGMTGTPLADKPLDIYGQFRILDPSIFGTNFRNFQMHYAVMDPKFPSRVLYYIPDRKDEFRLKMSQITYHCDESVLDLIPPVHEDVPVELSDRAKAIFKSMKRDALADLPEGQVTAGNLLTRVGILQQITSGFARLDNGEWSTFDTSKRDTLTSLLDELNGEPVVVFCQYHKELDSIKEAALEAGTTSLELSGRKDQLAEWKNGDSQVLAVQIQAGGDTIDLTRSRFVVYYSTGHSLTNYTQSLARTQRPGQKRRVTYYHLMAIGTLDKSIQRALQSKREISMAYAESLIKGEG